MLVSSDASGREPAVHATIAAHVPEAAMWLPAHEDSLPLARQALRAFGASIGVSGDVLEDAEIATTEAMANAVEHAYEHAGVIELTLSASADSLSVTVRDRGRGVSSTSASADTRTKGQPGYGISIIESIARDVEVTAGDGGQGTEVVISFQLDSDEASAASAPDRLEAVVRRTVAVVAAQDDLAVASLSDLLEIVGRAARGVPRHLVDAAANIAIDRVPDGFELRVGPLDPAGARELADMASTRLAPQPLNGTVKLLPSRSIDAGAEDLVIRLTTSTG
jgi:serine/threonine-protein kinase RsbW